MLRAIVLKQILWPQKQEDRDEGGWKSDSKVGFRTGYKSQDGGEGDGQVDRRERREEV